MKFKQPEEESPKKEGMSKELHDGFVDLIQFEIDKLGMVCSAKYYFYETGQMSYKKFFKYLYKQCEEVKWCMISFLKNSLEEVPQFKIPAIIPDFENAKEPFEKLAEMEDEFVEKLNSLIDIAFSDRNWIAFHYLLKKIDTIDHLCCRALAAVENKADVLDLIPKCESHTSEK